MAKGLRSKIKRHWRTELREKWGKPLQDKQQSIIQEELTQCLVAQSAGGSLDKLREALKGNAPLPGEEEDKKAEESKTMITPIAKDKSLTTALMEMDNEEALQLPQAGKAQRKGTLKKRKRRKKLVHF